jgi:hypothetical protein
MYRTGIRPLVGGVEVDIPLQTFVAGQALRYNAGGYIDTVAISTGISGPGTSVNGNIVVWNGTGGNAVADSGTSIAAINASIAARGDFSGPGSAVSGNVVSFNGTSGKLGQDSGKLAADLVVGPASATSGRVAVYNGATGKLLQDGTKLEADLVTGPASVTALHVPMFPGTSGTAISSSGVSINSVVKNLTGISSVAGNLPSFTSTSGTAIQDSGVSAANIGTMGVIPSSSQRILVSTLPTITAAATVTTRCYFVYVGFTTKQVTINRVEGFATSAGTPTNYEVGLFSSPLAPCRAGQTLTKLVSGTVTTGTGLIRNTTAFATNVAAGVHLWAALRTSASTQPTLYGHTADFGDGMILSVDSATLFSAAASYAGATIAASVTAWQCPVLRATVDS